MKEISISQPDSDGIVSSKRKKIDLKIVFPFIIVLVLVCNIVNSMVWKSCSEKYYQHFLEKNSIDTSCINSMSSWGFVPYSYKGADISLVFCEPERHKYVFFAGLVSEYINSMEYWEVPFVDYKFTYELDCIIDRFGRKVYSFHADKYGNDPGDSFDGFCFLIMEDGTFVYNSEGFPELTDEEIKIIDYMKNDILDLKGEVDKIIS